MTSNIRINVMTRLSQVKNLKIGDPIHIHPEKPEIHKAGCGILIQGFNTLCAVMHDGQVFAFLDVDRAVERISQKNFNIATGQSERATKEATHVALLNDDELAAYNVALPYQGTIVEHVVQAMRRVAVLPEWKPAPSEEAQQRADELVEEIKAIEDNPAVQSVQPAWMQQGAPFDEQATTNPDAKES